MKYSNKARHYAPRKQREGNKNVPDHRSHGGARSHRRGNTAAETVRMLYGAMSRRTRQAFIAQERAAK